MSRAKFSLSVVSHGHKEFIGPLLRDLAALHRFDFEVIITLNVSEDLGIDCAVLPFKSTLIHNASPKSFAANHNAAFSISQGDYFVVLNPDIRLVGDPFDALLELLQTSHDCICAPLVINQNGLLEDSARNFPTPLFLTKKILARIFKVNRVNDFVPAVNGVSAPDWIAGMFMVVPRAVYKKLNGLDERYRMYYEDVDFCARARLVGYKVMVNGYAKVIHEAQRESHRNFRYFVWHLRSAIRFFTSKVFLKIQVGRFLGNARRL